MVRGLLFGLNAKNFNAPAPATPMSFRTTIITACILIAVVAIAYFGEFKRGEKKKAAEEKKNLILEIKKGDVGEIRLDTPEQKIKIVPAGADTWKITEPIQSRADQAAVDRIFSGFEKLKYREIVEEKPSDLSAYELDKPKATLRFILKKGNAEKAVMIGGKNPVENVHYIRINGDPRVYLIEGDAPESASISLLELRDKKLTDFNSEKVESIRVQKPELNLLFKKESGVWKLKEPVESPASDAEVSSLLSSLEFLRAEQFIDQPSANPADYGFDKPPATVELSLEKGLRQKIIFGKKDGDKIYSRIEGSGTVATVNDSFSTIFAKKLDDWREKKLIVFNRFDAEDFRIKVGGKDYHFKKGKEEKWSQESPAKGEVDEEKVQELMEKLETAEIARFGEKPSIQNPTMEIFINLKDWQNKITKKHLVFGTVENNQQEVRNDDYSTIVYTVSSLQQEIGKAAEELKPKPPAPAKPSKK